MPVRHCPSGGCHAGVWNIDPTVGRNREPRAPSTTSTAVRYSTHQLAVSARSAELEETARNPCDPSRAWRLFRWKRSIRDSGVFDFGNEFWHFRMLELRGLGDGQHSCSVTIVFAPTKFD